MMSNFELETLKALPPCHPQLVEAIITQIKSQGLFDDFRKSCLSDIDTKPSYLNLKQRVEGYVNNFLSRQQWSSALQRNQLRETLRKDINESGLLKTGLDHLVDQLLYAHAEKSIRPKVRAEIKRFLNLTDASEQPPAACVSHYPMAVPPHYGPPAMPPLPPVPPPPDVTGAMMDTFGDLKPPEPPSPHGSEYSVDMSDSSMVGRDEAPPAIPNRSTAEKFELNENEVICNDSMDIEETKERNQDQTPLQCSSPEIFEEVSEGGSLGGTPVRDEDSSDPETQTNHTRTDFTGLFKDKSTTDLSMENETEVIVDEESMVFEVSEEYVKSEELAKNDEKTETPTVDDEALSSQAGDLVQTNLTPIMDEVLAEDDNMQISSDEETQCEDEVQTPLGAVQIEKRAADSPTASKIDPNDLKRSEVEEDFHGSLDADLSDTQPPLQIDTEDTEFTVIEKNQVDDSQEANGVADVSEENSQGPTDADNKGEPPATSPGRIDEEQSMTETAQTRDPLEAEKSQSEKSDSYKPEPTACNDTSSAPESANKTQPQHTGGAAEHAKDPKQKERRSSSHQKTTSRGDGDRDRRREHRSHHRTSSSSSKSKKPRDHEQSRSRDKDSVDKRDDRKDKEHERRRERDGKSRARDRDRAQRDSKHRSSSHSRRRHSRHHQNRQGDDDRKVQSSTSSSSSKTNRDRNEETRPRPEVEKSDATVEETTGAENSFDDGRSGDAAIVKSSDIRSTEAQMTPPGEDARVVPPEESSELTLVLPSQSAVASTSNTKDVSEDDIGLESEVPLKKRKRRVSKQQDSEQSRVTESKDVRKETPAAKERRRRSSAASVTSQQSLETMEQPESPVPSKFGRQRKINPKYEDDGTLSALLFGKQNS